MQMNLSSYTWHALFCPPNQELKMGHRLAPLGHPFVVPTEKSWRQRLARRGEPTKLTREAAIPTFPRYVFAGFQDRPNWEFLRERVPILQGYMAFGGGPAIINAADMQWLVDLRDRLAGNAPPKPVAFEDSVKPGDKVRVGPGSPFTGIVVTVDRVVAKEVHTFHQFLGGLVLVKIGLANLEPVE